MAKAPWAGIFSLLLLLIPHSSHFPAQAETQSTLPNWDGQLISYFWKSSNNFLKSERSHLAKHLREEISWSVAEGAVVWLHSVRREWKSKNSIQYTLNLRAYRGSGRDKKKEGKWKTNLIVDCVTISHCTFGQHLMLSSNINHPGHPISSSCFLFRRLSWMAMVICLPRITVCHAQGGSWTDRKTRSKTWIKWLNFTAKKNITVAEKRKKGRHQSQCMAPCKGLGNLDGQWDRMGWDEGLRRAGLGPEGNGIGKFYKMGRFFSRNICQIQLLLHPDTLV